MSPETILIVGAIVYAGIMYALMHWLFPKNSVTLVPPSYCSHQVRKPYEPESYFGDESDYRSECCGCGAVLRWHPNV